MVDVLERLLNRPVSLSEAQYLATACTLLGFLAPVISTLVAGLVAKLCWNYVLPSVANIMHISYFKAVVLALGMRFVVRGCL
jgi:hypothetical protein